MTPNPVILFTGLLVVTVGMVLHRVGAQTSNFKALHFGGGFLASGAIVMGLSGVYLLGVFEDAVASQVCLAVFACGISYYTIILSKIGEQRRVIFGENAVVSHVPTVLAAAIPVVFYALLLT